MEAHRQPVGRSSGRRGGSRSVSSDAEPPRTRKEGSPLRSRPISPLFLLLLVAPPTSICVAGEEILLWRGAAPGSEGLALEEIVADRSTDPDRSDRAVTHILRPSLIVRRPTTPNGTAVVIAPGGGYHRLVIDKEGLEVADWLNGLGVTAFVLRYRLPEEGHATPEDVALADGQRAMRLVREQSAALRLDPRRIGVLGFSAGGHLAGSLAAYHEVSVYAAVDDADRMSARPDFAILVYPALTTGFVDADTLRRYPGLRRVVSRYPLDTSATRGWPPTFLVHTADDASVDPLGSLRMFEALRSAGTAAEIHVFGSGGHGFGLRETGGPASRWPVLCAEWLATIGVL